MIDYPYSRIKPTTNIFWGAYPTTRAGPTTYPIGYVGKPSVPYTPPTIRGPGKTPPYIGQPPTKQPPYLGPPPKTPPYLGPPRKPPKAPPYEPPYQGPPYTPGGPPPRRPPEGISKRKRLMKRGLPGFETYVKRRGRWFKIGRVRPKGIATLKGISFVKSTLGASFFIKRVPQKVFTRDINVQPSKLIFRKPIQRGIKQISSPIWIQKAGTKRETPTIRTARLTSRGEREEIKRLRRKIKW